MRQARDEPVLDRVVQTDADDGNGLGCLPGCGGSRGGRRNDDAHLEPDHLFGQRVQPVVLTLGIPLIEQDVVANNPSRRAQSSPESVLQKRNGGSRAEIPDARRLVGPTLRAPGGGERGSSAEKSEDVAPPHSMTSSARASSDGGKVRPRAFAVFRLMTSSNLVAW